MKKILLLAAVFIFSVNAKAQPTDNYDAIKLFLDPQSLLKNKDLTEKLQNRLGLKVTQLINQTGIAETGYSNFLVVPKFDVLSNSASDAGMSKVYLAECELTLTVERRSYSGVGGATFKSFSKKTNGSSLREEDAIANAINSISTSDKDFVNFIIEAKAKISEYFRLHCKDVISEADQAYKLQDYAKSIALYFSVPSSAKECYEIARASSLKVYKEYLKGECNANLIKLKAYVARAQNTDSSAVTYYDDALYIIKHLDPASGDCYAEAEKQIEKIEKRFDEKQKQEWELKRKLASDAVEVQKETVKAMGRISSTYQPSSAPTVIITK